MRKAAVYFGEEKAGTLEEIEEGFRSSYDEEYLKNPRARAISLSLPLNREPYESPTFFPFFDGMAPEGWYLEIVSKTLKVDPEDRFGILVASAPQAIGAVSVRAL